MEGVELVGQTRGQEVLVQKSSGVWLAAKGEELLKRDARLDSHSLLTINVFWIGGHYRTNLNTYRLK